ncbi:MAG: pilus assembly protein TadG-related protein, partial [Alphaproteobacteria bacterium]|nr:pilus assembly protein TadG-related protein [Alphaproteobacteria bacterium]
MTTLIVALVLVPLVAAMAVALDLARVSHSKGQLQQAVDTAVISAARTYATQLVENGGNAPDAYDQALSSGQNIFRSNYPGATLTLNFNVSGGFNGTAQAAVAGTLAAAMGLADVNPVAKACAVTPASGYTTLSVCSADAPPPCRPGAFPELSCNQSACPAGMYDQTYTYGVSGTVTESSCNTSTFKTKTCSLSCPPAPKPVGCDVYKIEFRHSYPGMGNISGDAPACLRNTWNSYTNFGTGHPFSDDYFFTYYYQDMDPIQNSDVRNCVGTIRSKIKTYTWIDNNCKVIASSVSNLGTELPNYRPHDYSWQLSAYGNYDKIVEANVYPCTNSINRQRVGWNPTQRELRALAERMALADNTAAREVAAMLKTRGRVCEGN